MNGFFLSIQSTMVLMALSNLVFLWLSGRLITTLFKAKALRWPLLIILALGLLLRFVWVESTQPLPLSDFKVYFDNALNFYHGQYAFDVIIRHPGPAILFAFAFYLLGAGLHAIWILNGMFSMIMILALYDLTRRLAGHRIALLAAFVTAVLPTLIAYTAIAGSEVPSVAFLVLFFWGFFELWDRQQVALGPWAMLGLLLAGAALLRSSSVLVMGVIPVLIVLFDRPHWRQRIQSFLALCLTLGLGLFSWMYHQHLVVGNGWKMYYGVELGFACAVQPGNRDGAYRAPSQWSFYPAVRSANETTALKNDILMYQRAGEQSWAIIRHNPADYLFNGFYRMRRVLRNAQTGLSWTAKGSRQVKSWPPELIKHLSTLSNVLWQILLFSSPLSLLALLQKKDPYQRTKLGITFYSLFFGLWVAFHWLMALSTERYGFQIAPVIIILGVLGLNHLLFVCLGLISSFKSASKKAFLA